MADNLDLQESRHLSEHAAKRKRSRRPLWLLVRARATASSPKGGQTRRSSCQSANKSYTVDCLSACAAAIVAQFASVQEVRPVPGG